MRTSLLEPKTLENINTEYEAHQVFKTSLEIITAVFLLIIVISSQGSIHNGSLLH
jgi:hypothetical protein